MTNWDCPYCGNDPEDCECECNCTEEAVDPKCPIHYTARTVGEPTEGEDHG